MLSSLSELATHKSAKEQLLRNVVEKGIIRNVLFRKSYTAAACNLALRSFSRLWPRLLPNLCKWLKFRFITKV